MNELSRFDWREGFFIWEGNIADTLQWAHEEKALSMSRHPHGWILEERCLSGGWQTVDVLKYEKKLEGKEDTV